MKTMGIALMANKAWAMDAHVAIATKSTTQPFQANDIQQALNILCPNQALHHIPEGQPFRLLALANYAKAAGDPDWEYPLNIEHGVPLGVEEATWTTPGVWPTKDELRGQPWEEEAPYKPDNQPNYNSATLHQDQIEETYIEEREMGMVLGPYTRKTAATLCNCQESEICCGALGAKDEGDKVRTIHDGTANHVNEHIRRNSTEKTTAPGLQDLIYCIQLTQSEDETAATGAEQCSDQNDLILIKADVTKAHRRIKVQHKDWKYMAAEIKGNIWINKCGTYGISSAQLYWGRMAALLTRLLYLTFPAILWAFVYVDDFIIILRRSEVLTTGYAILLFLITMGCPLSWKKTMIGTTNTWLGYHINTLTATAMLTSQKQTIILNILQELVNGGTHTADHILSTLGKLQWSTAICPLFRPFLQPFYAWQRATTNAGRPPRLIRYLAACLIKVYETIPRPQNGTPLNSTWAGASDAGADETKATIGGWIAEQTTSDPILQQNTWWFHITPNATTHPWAFDKTTPQQRIAALELYGTLILFRHLTHASTKINEHKTISLHIPMLTDNQGNAYSILNRNTKKWPCSAILMELCATAHHTGCVPNIEHTKRTNNTWADALTNNNFTGYDPNKRLHPDEGHTPWQVLDTILHLHTTMEQGSCHTPPPSSPRHDTKQPHRIEGPRLPPTPPTGP
jgi:hypothetical protein